MPSWHHTITEVEMVKRPDGIEIVQVNLRLPREMKKQIVDEAWNNRRSLNSEIICRLERDLARPEVRGAAA